MINFKDESGNTVTLQPGDYVQASDIDNEEMHNAIREAFRAAGCVVAEGFGLYHSRSYSNIGWSTWHNDFCWCPDEQVKRRVYPSIAKQTLFEAAKDAPDGTRFKIIGREYTLESDGGGKYLRLEGDGKLSSLDVLHSTDFEVIPSGPKKRDDIPAFPVTTNVPSDVSNECVDAFNLISRLMQWEGAQIGEPGYSIGELRYETESPLPYIVTFETSEQCRAAWKAECPEWFE